MSSSTHVAHDTICWSSQFHSRSRAGGCCVMRKVSRSDRCHIQASTSICLRRGEAHALLRTTRLAQAFAMCRTVTAQVLALVHRACACRHSGPQLSNAKHSVAGAWARAHVCQQAVTPSLCCLVSRARLNIAVLHRASHKLRACKAACEAPFA